MVSQFHRQNVKGTSAFNAGHIISAQRNNMHPETVEALAVVLEGYKNSII